MKLLLPLILFSSLSMAQSWKKMNLVNGCHIMDINGENVKSFPGSFCQFLDDGSYLSADQDHLKYFSKKNELIWQKDGHYHHQLNLTHDQKRILVLTSAVVKNIRQDKFQVLDLAGNIIAEELADTYLKQIKEKKPFSELELTHFNSFYEIPTLNEGLKLPEYVKPGNFILNSYRLGYFIVSSDLKLVLHREKFNGSTDHQTHDAQILPDGKLIYFNNIHSESEKSNAFSSVDEIDLTQNKSTVLFMASPKQAFFSRHCGGVQYLDKDHVLFSHMLAGTYIYSLKDQKMVSNIYRTHLNGHKFYPAQQVKALNLKKFLSHWK